MFRIAIVEDDVKSQDVLRDALDEYARESGEKIQISPFFNPEVFLSQYKPVYDIIFMDIEFGTFTSGMDAAKRLREYDPEVFLIFVTNMTQYAVQGYKVNALDYFVKPVSYYDLKLRMERIRKARLNALPRISIPIQGGIKSVVSSELFYVEILDHTLIYHTTEGDYTVRGESLKKLEKKLIGAGFARCSSSYLVNLSRCSSFIGDTVKVGKDTLYISRRMHKDFVNRFSEVLNNAGI